MRQIFFLFIIGFLIIHSCADTVKHNTDTKHSEPKTKYLSKSQLQADLNQLVKFLKDNHPALYEFTSRESFDSLFQASYNDIHDSFSEIGFYNLCSKIIAKVGCGHSGIYRQWSDSQAQYLPFDIKFIDGKGYIIGNYSESNLLKPKTEILQINDVSLSHIYNQLLGFASADGYNTSLSQYSINKYFSYYYANSYGFLDAFQIDYKLDSSSYTGTVTVKAINHQKYFSSLERNKPTFQSEFCFNKFEDEHAFNFSNTEAEYGFEICPEISLGIMTIKSFGFYDEQANEAFDRYVDNCFAKLEKENIHSLVLDVRDNGGGDPYCCAYVLSYLIQKPIIYFAKGSGYNDLEKHFQPQNSTYKGQVYTLTNGGCFSSTGHFCSLLKYHKIGIIIGQETGSTYRCSDNSTNFTLDYSGFTLRVARNVYTTAVEGFEKHRGILPDKAIDMTLDAYVNGVDLVKKSAIELIIR